MRTEERAFDGMRYVVRFPSDFSEGAKRPVILFLHGAGTRGDDIRLLENNPYFLIIERFADFPFVTVAPLCEADTWFDVFETLKRLVLHVWHSDFADPDRWYLMGASMGGYAAWQLAMSMPERFAAAVPICGGGMYWNAGRLVGVPVWAFHGQKDPVEESKKMVDAVKAAGGNARLTVFPENGHDAWSDVYGSEEVFKWLLTHKKSRAGNLTNEFQNSALFG